MTTPSFLADPRVLIAFLAILVSIVLLTKVSGGINVAVITPLLTVLGALGQNFRKGVAEKKEP